MGERQEGGIWQQKRKEEKQGQEDRNGEREGEAGEREAK